MSTEDVQGELSSCDENVASGWITVESDEIPFVIVRLDGAPAGAAAALLPATSSEIEPSEMAVGNRRIFSIELEPARAARGGTVTAECLIGTTVKPLAGRIVISPAVPPALTAGPKPTFAFHKPLGVTVTGWVACANRALCSPLAVVVDGDTVAHADATLLAPDAWKVGGHLASGFSIVLPIPELASFPVFAGILDEDTATVLWYGEVTEQDLLIGDISRILATGTLPHQQGADDGAIEDRIGQFCTLLRSDAAFAAEAVVTKLALDLANWRADHKTPAAAFDILTGVPAATLMRRQAARFTDTLASIICRLPVDKLDVASAWLSQPENVQMGSRLLDFLKILVAIRMSGLQGQSTRVMQALWSMNFSQGALNWIWEALEASPSDPAAVRRLRQVIELEIIARHVPFSGRFEFVTGFTQ